MMTCPPAEACPGSYPVRSLVNRLRLVYPERRARRLL